MRTQRQFSHLIPALVLGASVIGVLDAVASADETWKPQPFDRYTSIVDRMPFGKAAAAPSAADAAAEAAAKAPPPPWASQLVLCALNHTPAGGLAIGFTDNSQKPPHSYYLEKGESADGFTVTAASFEQETATIEKDGLSIDLKMGGKATLAAGRPATATATPASVPTPVAATIRPIATAGSNPALTNSNLSRLSLRGRLFNPSDPGHWPMPGSVTAIDGALSMGIQQESYVERLKQRREELLAKSAATTAAKDKEVEDRAAAAFQSMLRKQNLDAIRSGQGSLGIPLTPEEDAQLVTEGVLPAQQ